MVSLLTKVRYLTKNPFRCTYSVLSRLNMSVTLNVDEKSETNGLKRDSSEKTSELHGEDSAKKALYEKQDRIKKRKIAMMISYLGQGYLGLQRNPGTKTIEEDLLVAMLKAGYISDDVFNQPQLIQFQRAARTDKGVSALRQILSMKLPENADVEVINQHLPEQIRAMAMMRVTKGFNCKSNCDARTYSYMMPTFAFALHGTDANETFRLSPETRQRVGEVLKMFEGTHNFHNFTSKKLATDPSVSRYIISFTCEDPFVIDDLEFVILKVKGQSFMLHQIRKMVGLMIAIVRGLTTSDTLTRSWDREKLDIPIAPGLGLLLEEVHYNRYNFRYGNDGVHDLIDWSRWDDQVEQFRRKFILPTVVETEKSEKSMLTWLDSLNLHSFDVRTEHIQSELDQALRKSKGILCPPVLEDPLIPTTLPMETAR
ncbi:tRNA pseudouridine synthase A-like isoform X2 [Homalodisca vitripennis]|uniref:tRNA pseudouridine synthase A-like isoform X2 n=1 Tax=Homalodisca vitripennis TaxID=197043 RepID=UPI001EECAE9A|nr:tRNA pseudouridine synthase A-like isoform X2 [Homalodisca vitripennis]